jgi:NADPH-dependent glutamate synthase beta subunit-like oxidoreductase
MTMTHRTYHFVAVIGGAIAGSVAAEILADSGIHVVVVKQNKRPYGKIEDGLPRWHLEQRQHDLRSVAEIESSLSAIFLLILISLTPPDLANLGLLPSD